MIKKVYIPLQCDFFIVLDLRLIFVDKGCRETALILYNVFIVSTLTIYRSVEILRY